MAPKRYTQLFQHFIDTYHSYVRLDLGTVHTGLVNKGHLGFSCKHFSLLFVHKHVRIQSQGQQSNDQIQMLIRSVEVEILGNETILGEALVDENVLKMKTVSQKLRLVTNMSTFN